MKKYIINAILGVFITVLLSITAIAGTSSVSVDSSGNVVQPRGPITGVFGGTAQFGNLLPASVAARMLTNGNSIAFTTWTNSDGSTNYGIALSLTNSPNIYYVQTNGSDVGNSIGSMQYPWLTLTNALTQAVTPALINLGVGTFYVGNGTTPTSIPSNVKIQGQGISLTSIQQANLNTPNTTLAFINYGGLIIQGDNVEISDITLGTNMMIGAYYFPLEFLNGTNFYIHNIILKGDSDVLYGSSSLGMMTNTCSGILFNNTINSGYDTCKFTATGLATNSRIIFNNDIFNINIDTNFGGVSSRGIIASGIGLTVNNCTFNVNNPSNAAYGIDLISSSSPTNILNLQNNIFSIIGTSSYNIYNSGQYASIFVNGGIDSSKITTSVSIPIIYDNATYNNLSIANVPSGASSGWVFTLTNTTTGQGTWSNSPAGSSSIPYKYFTPGYGYTTFPAQQLIEAGMSGQGVSGNGENARNIWISTITIQSNISFTISTGSGFGTLTNFWLYPLITNGVPVAPLAIKIQGDGSGGSDYIQTNWSIATPWTWTPIGTTNVISWGISNNAAANVNNFGANMTLPFQ